MAFILLGALWLPVQVLLHEAAHAFAALALSDGEVSLSMREASVTYDAAGLRRPRDAAWIAAAGPAASLVAATLLWLAWLGSGADSLATVPGAGAFVATLVFVTSALPLRYGPGLNWPGDSDGLMIWKVLRGVPLGATEAELPELGRPERAIRPAFACLLVLAGALALLVEPVMVLVLAGLFGAAALLQSSDARR